MGQLFHRSTNTIAKATIIAIVILIGLLGTAAFFFVRSPYVTWVAEAVAFGVLVRAGWLPVFAVTAYWCAPQC